MPLIRLALAGLLAAVCAFAIACGGDDDDSTGSGVATADVSDSDEDTLDQAVETIIAALRDHSVDPLVAMASDRLLDRRAQLDERVAECFPEGGELSVTNREIRPGRENDVRLTIEFTVQNPDGETDDVRRDWRFERQDDGSFKLTDPPDCPFRNRPPTNAPTEAPTETELPTEAPTQVPLETLPAAS